MKMWTLSTRKSNRLPIADCRLPIVYRSRISNKLAIWTLAIGNVDMSFREHHSRWEFDLKSSPDSLWPFVADTNRFNRDTGVPKLDIEAGQKRLPNARRKVRLSIYGLPVEWEEQPFEWVQAGTLWR